MSQVFANNAASILNGEILAADITLDIRTGDASKFPSLGVGDFFMLTLVEYDGNNNEVNWEIVKVTAIAGDTFTITRAQEGTTAQVWPSGTIVENRLSAGTADNFARKNELNDGNWDLAFSWGDHAQEGYLKTVDWPIITSKPVTATRWPAWSEVTSKPSTFTPTSHTHLLSEVTDAGTAAAANTGTASANVPTVAQLLAGNWAFTGNNSFSQPLKASQFHQNSIVAHGNTTGAKTIVLASGNYQSMTLTGNSTFSFTAPAGPCSCNILITNVGAGNTITLPTVSFEAGAQNTLDAAKYILTVIYDGTNYWVSWAT